MNRLLPPGGPDPGYPGGVPPGADGHFLRHGLGVPLWFHAIELLLVLAVLLAIVLIIRAALRAPRGVASGPGVMINPALAELDLRYARGEIEREDYLTRRADLMGAGQTALGPPPGTQAPGTQVPGTQGPGAQTARAPDKPTKPEKPS